jgi:serine/threonine protein kinase
MPWELDQPQDTDLVAWIERAVANGAGLLAKGYQGAVYLYPGPPRLAIKTISGNVFSRWLHGRMLRREYAAYQKLNDFAGCPRCYGLLDGRYLVLEYVESVPLRNATLTDHAVFYFTLFNHIVDMHGRGVAHFDLKKKDNLLVTPQGLPCLIDFGAAIVRKPGFAPINHYLYALAARFDFNAWVKLKYDGKFTQASDADRPYYQRTRIEKLARAIKRVYQRLKPSRWAARP